MQDFLQMFPQFSIKGNGVGKSPPLLCVIISYSRLREFIAINLQNTFEHTFICFNIILQITFMIKVFICFFVMSSLQI